jgi:outer membrane protein OmpA-like peptidoglycan-associated protein
MMQDQVADGRGDLASGGVDRRGERAAAGHGQARLRLAVLALAFGLLSGCTAVNEMTQSTEAAAAKEPQRVTTEGAKDQFPTLGDVPSTPKAHTAPAEREKMVAEMVEDRSQATFSPQPLETAAAPDIFASSVVISGDSVTVSTQVAGLPAPAGGGQLAAIIFFSHGSSDLDAKDRQILKDIASLHQQRGGSLRIVGHASSRTRNSTPNEHQIANFDMSLTRANAVRDELLQLGIAADAMRAEALGDAEPVYHEFMPSGEAGNRRVEIFLEN